MLDQGQTGFLLIMAALVLFMTPGLAFFYGGLVKAKSVISMMMMSFGAIALVAFVPVELHRDEPLPLCVAASTGQRALYPDRAACLALSDRMRDVMAVTGSQAFASLPLRAGGEEGVNGPRFADGDGVGEGAVEVAVTAIDGAVDRNPVGRERRDVREAADEDRVPVRVGRGGDILHGSCSGVDQPAVLYLLLRFWEGGSIL